MNLTWHIVKKDLRRFRVSLNAMFALLIPLLAIVALIYNWDWYHWLQLRLHHYLTSTKTIELSNYPWYVAVFTLGMLAELVLLVYVIANVFKEDATDGNHVFWRTQPVSGTSMFAAKVIFIAIAALPLQIVSQMLAIALHLLPPYHIANHNAFFETSSVIMAVEMAGISLAIYLGISPRSSSTRFYSAWVFYFILFTVNVCYWLTLVTGHTHADILTRFGFNIFDAFWMFFVMAAAWLLYRYRSRKLVLLAYATGLLVANLAMTHFYLNL